MNKTQSNGVDLEIDALLMDLGNIQNALEYGVLFEPTRQIAVELALQLFHFVESAGIDQQWIAILDRLFSSLSSLPQDQLNDLYLQWGILAVRSQKLTNKNIKERIQLVLKHISQPPSEYEVLQLARAHHILAIFELRKNLYADADKTIQQAADLIGNREHSYRGAIYTSWGIIRLVQGEYDAAEKFLQIGSDQWRRLDRIVDFVRTAVHLSRVAILSDNFELALLRLSKVLNLLEQHPNEIEKVNTRINQGVLHYRMENYELAIDSFSQVNFAFLERYERHDLLAIAYHGVGENNFRLNRLEDARFWLERAVKSAEMAGRDISAGNSLGILGQTFRAMGDVEKFKSEISRALGLLEPFAEDQFAQKLIKKFNKLLQDSHP